MTEIKTEAASENISLSLAADNTIYVPCSARGGRHNYAVCLNVIKAYDEDRLGKETFTECQRAICGDYCPSKKMRAEEVKAGKALYYKKRVDPIIPVKISLVKDDSLTSTKGVDYRSESYKRGWDQASSKTSYKSKPSLYSAKSTAPTIAKPSETVKKEVIHDDSMVSLINEMANEQPSKIETKPLIAQAKPTAAEIAKNILQRGRNK